MKIKKICITAFCIGIFCFTSGKSNAQQTNNVNSNKTIDSLYSINQLKSIISVNEIRFRNTENFEDNNLNVRHINTQEVNGYNPMFKNTFLFITFSSKSLSLKNKIGNKTIKISVLNQSKTIDSKKYFWTPDGDGNYYIWLPLDNKYFDCIASKTNFKIDLIEEKTKAIIISEIIKYDTYCELD